MGYWGRRCCGVWDSGEREQLCPVKGFVWNSKWKAWAITLLSVTKSGCFCFVSITNSSGKGTDSVGVIGNKARSVLSGTWLQRQHEWGELQAIEALICLLFHKLTIHSQVFMAQSMTPALPVKVASYLNYLTLFIVVRVLWRQAAGILKRKSFLLSLFLPNTIK